MRANHASFEPVLKQSSEPGQRAAVGSLHDGAAAQAQSAEWQAAIGPVAQGGGTLQAKLGSDRAPDGGSRSEGSGRPLGGPERAQMETAFGADFAEVRVHEGGAAAQIGAQAYTRGSHIHFAPGAYAPGSRSGQALLGHELAHVVQQSRGRVQPTETVQGMPANTDPALEREADDLGERASRGVSAREGGSSGPTVSLGKAGGESAPLQAKWSPAGLKKALPEKYEMLLGMMEGSGLVRSIRLGELAELTTDGPELYGLLQKISAANLLETLRWVQVDAGNSAGLAAKHCLAKHSAVAFRAMLAATVDVAKRTQFIHGLSAESGAVFLELLKIAPASRVIALMQKEENVGAALETLKPLVVEGEAETNSVRASNGTKILYYSVENLSGGNSEKSMVQNALDVFDGCAKNTNTWRGQFNASHANHEGQLPGKKGAGGYQEHDVRTPGSHGAGRRRLVTDNNSSRVFYTWTHYGDSGDPAFVLIRK